MYEWKNAKVTANTRKAFELATDIAWRFDDEYLRSAYFLFAALNIPESAISKVLSDSNVLLLPDIETIVEDKEIFSKIFGKKAAEKVFDEREILVDQESHELTKEEKEEQEFAQKVLGVLAGAMGMEYDQGMGILVSKYSDKFENACEKAYFKCRSMNMDCLDLDVLIYTILENVQTSAYKFMEYILQSLGVQMENFMHTMKINCNIIDDEEVVIPIVIPPALESCLEILNYKYTKGEEITILGRDKEIYKVFNIFSKKTKRNAVLVGKPGVGKTAIIEAIAQHIVNETCPKRFVGCIVLSLDVNAMVAGTKYRGEFETKVAILKEFLEHTPNVILFVDEMHQMLGAGGTADGNVDLSGSLKPILSRDDVVFVGATTEVEYNTILARDGAFKRRFELIIVEEPKRHEVKGMIKAKLKKMEAHHGVELPDELVDYIILCSSCFNLENANPDKTLDLCDRSMAIAEMANAKQVLKDHINKVYEEYFERASKMTSREVRATACHEIGHYIATRLSKQNENHKVVAVSIISTNDYLGANIIEQTDDIVACDMEYATSYLMSLFAGRVAQKLEGTWAHDSGASDDLMRAKKIAKRVIMEFGMDQDDYENIYLLDEDLLGEEMKQKISPFFPF